jgi:hypothetical protein
MSGMLHLPHGSDALLADRSALFEPRTNRGAFRHTITHRHITFEVIEADLLVTQFDEGEWLATSELFAKPHASYVRKALALL